MSGDDDSAASGPPLGIEVTASRWNWRFEYPDGAIEQGSKSHVPVLRVPVGAPISFRGTSIDVIHSFWVPEERFKRDLLPGMWTSWEMVFDRVANWPAGGECAEFCGLEHARMVFDVLVMPPAAFERWLRTARRTA
jgi:cytochrome c oxidase subunit 2